MPDVPSPGGERHGSKWGVGVPGDPDWIRRDLPCPVRMAPQGWAWPRLGCEHRSCGGLEDVHDFLHRTSDAASGFSRSRDPQVCSRSRIAVTEVGEDHLDDRDCFRRIPLIRDGLGLDGMSWEPLGGAIVRLTAA